MKFRPILIIGGLIGLIIFGAVAWYLLSPLFIDNTVDEAFPFETPSQAQLEAMSDEEMKELETKFMDAMPSEEEIAALAPEAQAEVEQKVLEAAAVVMSDKAMDDEMMEAAADEWLIVGQGQFAGADNFHQGSGNAAIFQQGDQRVLRLEDFSVTNGPDLHVLLIENATANGRSELGEYVDLGPLKGNIGNQNYEIPADVDLSQYGGVMIYCMPFHVVFATAPLAN